MREFALSTNLYTFAQVEMGFFGWPASAGEGELIRTLELGDLIVPKFAQSPDYGVAGEGIADQREYCEHIGVDYDAVVAQYQKAIGNGSNVVPYIMRVTGATDDKTDPWGGMWASVTVQKIEVLGGLSTKEFLLVRALPESIAAQFKALVAPGRHLQELPAGTARAVQEAAASVDRAQYLRRYSVVLAVAPADAESILAGKDRAVRPGDRVFLASHAGLLGIHDVAEDGHLTAVGPPISKTPDQLLELFEQAARRARPSDNFAPSRAIAAAKELLELLEGPTDAIAVDDFSRFHDSYELLSKKVTQALELANRALPAPVAAPQTPVTGTDGGDSDDAEVDEIAALAGLTIEAVRAELPPDMVIADTVLAEAVTALRSGKHLLLGGPPGTGKSTLAEALCRAVVHQQYDVTTGTADWTTFDTIGGYMPHADGPLSFEPGVVLRALKRGRWLIIDELNRADIDKAFGPLFTLLASSGGTEQQRRVVLPYHENGRQIEIRWAEKRTGASGADYVLTAGWRLIGTLNLSDKATLFQLSFAFLRRFAVLDVPLPDKAGYHAFAERCETIPQPERDIIADAAIELAFGPRQLGPAILSDIAVFMTKGTAETASGRPTYSNHLQAFMTAVRLFAVPQYEGATSTQTKAMLDTFRSKWPDLDEDALRPLNEALRAVELS